MGVSANMFPASHIADIGAESVNNVSISAFGLAMIGVLWSFGGWHHTSFLAGEAKNANRNIPRAMVYGTLIVLLVYILTNIAYMFLMPVGEIARSESIAADALAKVLPIGGLLVAILIAISTFGTALVDTLSGPRIYYAMANDGLFFKKLTRIHPKFNTPVNSIIAQSIWALIILFMWRTFEAVITYVTFIDWIFFFLTAIIVILFRIKRKDAHRPFKTPLYPVVPLIFIITSFLFVLNTLAENIIYAGAGLGLLLLGTPVYFYFKRSKTKPNG
jgi:APA family basic amino acid/polyamine antiporter